MIWIICMKRWAQIKGLEQATVLPCLSLYNIISQASFKYKYQTLRKTNCTQILVKITINIIFHLPRIINSRTTSTISTTSNKTSSKLLNWNTGFILNLNNMKGKIQGPASNFKHKNDINARAQRKSKVQTDLSWPVTNKAFYKLCNSV